MEAELKPCPYCGGAASLALCGFGTAKVVCMDCGSEGSYSPTREEAIAAWNRRTPDGVGASLDPDCCPDCGDPECPGCDGVPYRDEDAAGVGAVDATSFHCAREGMCDATPRCTTQCAACADGVAATAPTGPLQQMAAGIQALDEGHDPLCMAVLRGKACTCGVAPTFPRNVPMDPQAMRERAAGVPGTDGGQQE